MAEQTAADRLAADLREMDSVGAISLSSWPNAREWMVGLVGDASALEEARSEVRALREVLRLGTELDNHHNAQMCPYCTPDINERERRIFVAEDDDA